MTDKARNKKKIELSQEEIDFMRPALTRAMLGLTIKEKQKMIRQMVKDHYDKKRNISKAVYDKLASSNT